MVGAQHAFDPAHHLFGAVSATVLCARAEDRTTAEKKRMKMRQIARTLSVDSCPVQKWMRSHRAGKLRASRFHHQ